MSYGSTDGLAFLGYIEGLVVDKGDGLGGDGGFFLGLEGEVLDVAELVFSFLDVFSEGSEKVMVGVFFLYAVFFDVLVG